MFFRLILPFLILFLFTPAAGIAINRSTWAGRLRAKREARRRADQICGGCSEFVEYVHGRDEGKFAVLVGETIYHSHCYTKLLNAVD